MYNEISKIHPHGGCEDSFRNAYDTMKLEECSSELMIGLILLDILVSTVK